MSQAVARSVLIARPAPEVFAFVSDLRNDPRWCRKVLSCEQVAGDGPGLDARFGHFNVGRHLGQQLAALKALLEPPG